MTSRRAGRFHRLLLPPIILQSVLIGGGYSTGREVVEYAAKHGPAGWVSVLVIFAGFTLFSILVFELARVTRCYDYKSWIQQLIGPVWPLFDLLLFSMLLLVIAVMISAVEEILQVTTGMPPTVSTSIAFSIVAVLAYLGEETIERFKTLGTALLYAGYSVFAAVVLAQVGGDAGAAVGRVEVTRFEGAAVLSGLLYVGYNLAVYPVVLFSLYRQSRRRDTVTSGVIAGAMMTLPFALTWLCLLGFWPSREPLEADVPWLVMLADRGGAWIIVLYGLVVGWTLVETAIGGVHALADRVEKHLGDLPRFLSKRLPGLSPLQRGLFAATILLLALALSRLGIIALVARGYGIMAYLFLALMAVPLLTVGAMRISRGAPSQRR